MICAVGQKEHLGASLLLANMFTIRIGMQGLQQEFLNSTLVAERRETRSFIGQRKWSSEGAIHKLLGDPKHETAWHSLKCSAWVVQRPRAEGGRTFLAVLEDAADGGDFGSFAKAAQLYRTIDLPSRNMNGNSFSRP
jgi:hypothetical protein